MAIVTMDRDVIQQWMRDKQQNEQELARNLYDRVFNGPALPQLRQLAEGALTIMLQGEDPQVLFKAMNTEKFLRVYDRARVPLTNPVFARVRVRTLLENISAFDATDVSDVIRLFGQWVEDGGLMAPGASGSGTDAWGQTMSDSNLIKDAYRAGVQTGEGSWKSEVESVWSDTKGRFRNVPGARRDRAGRTASEGVAAEDEVRRLMAIAPPRDPAGFSGMFGTAGHRSTAKAAARDSNVLKLDRIFGLLVGADISGTTTDTVSVLENLANLGMDGLTASYYLLPVATIVYNSHHTLIEVALALSLNKCIDYHVGFYTTLLPRDRYRPAAFDQAETILQTAENSVQNRHFLVWYNAGQIAGAVQFDQPAEKMKLKQLRLSKATALVKRALTLPSFPTAADIGRMIAEMALPLEKSLRTVAGAPRAPQARQVRI